MKARIRQALLCAVCLALLGGKVAAAEPAAALTEGASYALQAAELSVLMDSTLSRDVVCEETGLALRDGALTGVYVTLPIAMDEFTRVTVTADLAAAAGRRMPLVEMSTYQPEPNGWGEWMLLPDGKTAARDKGTGHKALVRYRITLTRAEGTQPSPTLRGLSVSADDPAVSSTSLILLTAIALGLFLLLYRGNLRRKATRRK